MVSEPMELLGIDFFGPFLKFNGTKSRWVLVAIDYFSRYIWAEATEQTDSETVIRFLGKIFSQFGVPVGIYSDPEPHFGTQTKKFAEGSGVVWCDSPVAAKAATGMVEKAIDIFQRVLKMSSNPSEWPDHVSQTVFEVNNREIVHLSHSPVQILFGFEPSGATTKRYPEYKREALSVALKGQDNLLPGEDEHVVNVIDLMSRPNGVRRETLGRSDGRKDLKAQIHDIGVRATQEYNPGDLVMLFDHREAGKKLRPSWRGPFVVVGLGGEMGKLYCLRQIEGTPIPRHYHGDALKPFGLREGYLVSKREERLLIVQNIRLGTAAFKLPKDQRTRPGA
ncbi:hypothetical protein K3495_g11896 [Podosphaera aphanis]|nr:hypothetical protein K3495_g11896 [Podosphaera aphanis]